MIYLDLTISKPVSIEKIERFDREWEVTRFTKTNEQLIFDSMTNIEKYHLMLPQYINSIKILNKTQDVLECQNCESLIPHKNRSESSKRTIEFVEITTAPIKTVFIAKHIIWHDEYFHTLQILSGDTKGSIIEQTFETNDDSIQIKTAFRLHIEGLLKAFGSFQKPAYIKFTIPIIDQMINYSVGFDNESKNIVDNLYREILKRPADSQGLEYYSQLIESKEITEEDLRKILLESEESKLILDASERKSETELSDETRHIVNQLYNEILYRNVDRVGLELFGSLIEAKKITSEDLKKILLESEEKQKILEPDEKKSVNELSSETRQKINLLYQELFFHKADEKGLEYWGSLIEAKKLTYDELKQIMKQSPEYIQR